MTKKIKVVIWRRGKDDETHYFDPAQYEGGFVQVRDNKYFLDPGRFVVTRGVKYGFIPVSYNTFFFREGRSKPVPTHIAAEADEAQDYISSKELNNIFDEFLYDALKDPGAGIGDRLIFYWRVAVLACVVFSAWVLNTVRVGMLEGGGI